VTELIRKMGISEQTFYPWKKQYAGTSCGPVAGPGDVARRNLHFFGFFMFYRILVTQHCHELHT
jgi:hypothetical protein